MANSPIILPAPNLALSNDSSVLPAAIPSLLAYIGPQLATIALLATVLLATRFYRQDDPYNLKKIPKLPRSRLLDFYRTGQWWRLIIPRFIPYVKIAYHKYSKKGKPFRFWITPLGKYVYVLPPKYLEKIKNQSQPALNLRIVIQDVFPRMLENFVAQVGVKLVNANLSEIDPILQDRTDDYFDRTIGKPKAWKSINAAQLSRDIVQHVSGRIVFGENLVDDPAFFEPMGRYAMRLVGFGMLARRLNFWPVKNVMRFVCQRILKRDLAIVTRFVAEEVAKRRKMGPDTKKPFDSIQWAMEQDIPEDQKTPALIAERLAFATSGMINTPPGTVQTLFFDAAFYREYVEEIRTEIHEVLAADGNGWVETSIAKMKKLEAFVQESLRLSASLAPLTGWREVMRDEFRFDDGFALPKGTIMTFPTYYMRTDPNTFDEPDRFDPLRFEKLKEQNDGKEDLNSDGKTVTALLGVEKHANWLVHTQAIRHRSLLFGYGRQGCPGRFYATRMMKLMTAVMISRYDIRFAGGDRATTPDSGDIEPFFHPDTSVELEFRARN